MTLVTKVKKVLQEHKVIKVLKVISYRVVVILK